MSFLFGSKSADGVQSETERSSSKDHEVKSVADAGTKLPSTTTAVIAVSSRGSRGRGARSVIRDLSVARLTDPTSSVQRIFSLETPIAFKLAVGDNKPWNTIQSVAALTTIVSSNLIEVDTGFSFSASTLAVSASLLGAFDQYRFMEIEVLTIARRTPQTAAAIPGTFAIVVDYDNNTAAALSVLDNYANVQICSGADCTYTRFVPHSAVSVGTTSGGVVTGGNVSRQWLDSNNATVAHFGVKTAWTSTDVAYTRDVHVRAWLQFRNVF